MVEATASSPGKRRFDPCLAYTCSGGQIGKVAPFKRGSYAGSSPARSTFILSAPKVKKERRLFKCAILAPVLCVLSRWAAEAVRGQRHT